MVCLLPNRERIKNLEGRARNLRTATIATDWPSRPMRTARKTPGWPRPKAERGDATAGAAAERASWTADELRKVGLDAPGRNPPADRAALAPSNRPASPGLSRVS